MEERVKRPKLKRTQAARTVSSLLGLAGGAPPRDDATAEQGAATFGDVVGRSVDLGYRVVEDYIRQGQKTAERMASRNYGQEALTGDLQELGMRVVRYASEFMAVWFDFMERAAAGGVLPSLRTSDAPPPPADPGAGPDVARSAGTAGGDGGARVSVEVASPWPTEVAIDLRPGVADRRLVLHALRALEPEKPRLEGVSFQPGSGAAPPVLRIQVPAEQPAGVYYGLLVDEQTAAPAGTLSVRISRPS